MSNKKEISKNLTIEELVKKALYNGENNIKFTNEQLQSLYDFVSKKQGFVFENIPDEIEKDLRNNYLYLSEIKNLRIEDKSLTHTHF